MPSAAGAQPGYLGCANPLYNGQSAVTASVTAGTTYYIQAGDFQSGGGPLSVNVELILPPANDNFAAATRISTLPFRDSGLDLSSATIEPGEPALCTPPASEKTAWYAYTAEWDGTVSARVTDTPVPIAVGAYIGGSPTGLTQLACQYGSFDYGGQGEIIEGASEQLVGLAAAVKGLGPGKSLAATVATAQWLVAHGQIKAACLTLTAFNLEVKAQSGKKIPKAQTTALIADANRIRAVLGC